MNNQKGFTNIILVTIIVVILVGTVGYFIFIKKSEPITQQPTTAQTTASNSGKAYQNNQYGFEVKHPEGWAIDESGKLGTVVIFFNPVVDQSQSQTFQANINILIRPLKNLGLKNIDEYVNLDKSMLLKYFPDVKFYPDEKISLSDGKEARIISLSRMQNNMLIHDRHIIVINNDNAYVMALTALDSKWDTYINLIDSVFSSFKFIQ